MMDTRSADNLPPLPDRGPGYPSHEEVPDLWTKIEYWSIMELLGALFGEKRASEREIETVYSTSCGGCWGPLFYNSLRFTYLDRPMVKRSPRKTLFIVRHRTGWKWALRGGYGGPTGKVYAEGTDLKSLWKWACEMNSVARLPPCPGTDNLFTDCGYPKALS